MKVNERGKLLCVHSNCFHCAKRSKQVVQYIIDTQNSFLMFTWCPFKVKHFLKCVTWIITFVLLLPYIVWLRLPKSSLEQVRECTAVPLAATSGPQVLWAEQAVLLHVVSERSSKEERRGENVLMLPDPERHHVSVPQLGLVPQGDDRVHQVWLMLSFFLSLFPTRLFHWVPALLIMAFVFFFCFVLFCL